MFSSTKLRQIVGIDRAGSFSAAARTLNVSQSTLTKAVADIEKDIGYMLFSRTARGVNATPEGREFLNRAARIVADFDMLESDARNLKSANEAYLRVGLSPASQEGLYNRAIANLLKANPEICVSVQGMPDERGVRLLKRGDLDLLFAPYDMLEHEKEFATERISQIKVGPFCRKGHPILSIKNPSADDMSAYKVIANIGIGYARKVAEVLIPRHVDQHRQMHIIDNFSIVAETVLATNAIGIISLDYARSQTFKEQFTLLTPELVQPIELGVARLSRWLPSPAVRACVESVKHELHKAEV